MADAAPAPAAVPLSRVPGTAELRMGLRPMLRGSVLLANQEPQAVGMELVIWWELPLGRRTAPLQLGMNFSTSPFELGVWLTRLAAEVFRQATEREIEARPAPSEVQP